jgi:hypothetical protein
MPSVPILDQRVEGIDKKLEKAYYKIRELKIGKDDVNEGMQHGNPK